MRTETLTKFVALFDIHIGWQKYVEGGRSIMKKAHDERALNVVMDFIKDFRPDVLILGGDQLNCGPVSRWMEGRPRQLENFRLKPELEMFKRLVLSRVNHIKRKVWLEGNHERWIQTWLDSNPALEGMVEPFQYLGLDKAGWEYRDQGKIFSLGKLNWVHGDIVFGRKNGGKTVHPARKLVNYYRRNMRAGHIHTWDATTDVTPYDRRDYHTGVVVPALAAMNQSYEQNATLNHQQGFNFGYILRSGEFSDYVSIINRGLMIWNGKSYGRTK